MTKSKVNVAMGELFRGKVVSCPAKVNCIKGLSFNCQYADGRLHMSGTYGIKTNRITKLSQLGNLAIFKTESGSTYILELS